MTGALLARPAAALTAGLRLSAVERAGEAARLGGGFESYILTSARPGCPFASAQVHAQATEPHRYVAPVLLSSTAGRRASEAASVLAARPDV